MQSVLKKIIDKKKILILGFGREGKSTLREILEAGNYADVTISDMKAISESLPEGIKTITGEGYLDCLEDYDLVFKSPGVVLKKPADEYSCLITSEVDVFMERFGAQTIGITGTKGKSTTSSLIAHILEKAGKDVVFAGNIGIPVFDVWKRVTENSVVVLELSCHQLEYLQYAPHRAVLLNIYEDHLDHYGSREKYALAKMNIYKKQEEGDFLYVTEDFAPKSREYKGNIVPVAVTDAPFSDFEDIPGASLRGKHNVLNSAFAYVVTKEFGVSEDIFISALTDFKGLHHRLEYLGNKDGIDYYDDSISTTVQSAISAVESIKNAGVLLLGGMERNLEYEELIEYLYGSKLDLVVFMYASGERMYKMYTEGLGGDGAPGAKLCKNLKEAVDFAKNNALLGKAVILSPASASYDSFKNFEERGDIYKSLVF